jgi:hypothetical protein
MKLPRRRFLHLATGAAALPVASRIARAQAYGIICPSGRGPIKQHYDMGRNRFETMHN